VLTGLAALSVLAQVYGLYRPAGPAQPAWFPGVDKLQHAVGFALPVLLVLHAEAARVRSNRGPSRRFCTATAVAFAGHAVVSEVIQGSFYRSRTGDPYDVAADWVGITLGLLAHYVASRRGRRGD